MVPVVRLFTFWVITRINTQNSELHWQQEKQARNTLSTDGNMISSYRRYRDLNALGIAAIYFLNIVDAMIDANFFYYDVSDNLTMHVQPAVFNNPGATSSLGLQINLLF
jgi:hypothetical protein